MAQRSLQLVVPHFPRKGKKLAISQAMKHYAIAFAVLLLAATQLPEAIEASKRNSCLNQITKSSITRGKDWVEAYVKAARVCR